MTILEEENKSNSPPVTGKVSGSNPSSGTSNSPVNLKTTSPILGLNSAVEINSQAHQIAAVAAISQQQQQNKNHILNSMISNVADRYITPEYLAPLPSSVRINFFIRVEQEFFKLVRNE